MSLQTSSRFRYSGWPPEAVDLVEHSIRVHGGWDAWKSLEVIRIELEGLRGLLLARKGLGRTFGMPRRLELRPHRDVAIFEGFPDEGKTGLYESGVVSILDAKTTETLIGSRRHRQTFAGKAKRRRWSPLDALYFLGYAFLHDHSTPFTLGEAGFLSMRSVRCAGEEMTALELDFPPERETHCTRQTFFVGREGLVRRQDFVVEIIGAYARGSQFSDDYDLVDGFKLPMRRQVRARLSGTPLPFVVLDASFGRVEVETTDLRR